MAGNSTEMRRLWLYGSWLLLLTAMFWRPVATLIRYSMENDNASHVLLIPVITAFLLYYERKLVFSQVNFDFRSGAILIAAALAVVLATLKSAATAAETGWLLGYTLAFLLFCVAGFALIFGWGAAVRARFPLLFLLLMVPLPDSWLNYAIFLLQKGSADIAEMIFDLARVPALREGFVFHLAHLNIEVAKECSGIRSSLALLILSLLVGHLFFKPFWKQLTLVIVGLLIMIVKNGIRIATLTILAQYVDPSFLYGRLHHEGGIVFFLIGLALLFPVFWLLQRGEQPRVSVADATAA